MDHAKELYSVLAKNNRSKLMVVIYTIMGMGGLVIVSFIIAALISGDPFPLKVTLITLVVSGLLTVIIALFDVPASPKKKLHEMVVNKMWNEEDFARDILSGCRCNNVWIGKKYVLIIWGKGSYQVYKTDGLIWTYVYSNEMKHGIVLVFKNGKTEDVYLNGNNSSDHDAYINYIRREYPHVLTGNSAHYQDLFMNDFQTLVRMVEERQGIVHDDSIEEDTERSYDYFDDSESSYDSNNSSDSHNSGNHFSIDWS